MIVPSGNKKYPYKFNKTFKTRFPYYGNNPLIIDNYVELKSGELTIFKDYHFNGCDQSPDFKKALRGCGVHDALIQLYKKYGKPKMDGISKKMREIHKEDKFFLWRIYYLGVKIWWAKTTRRIIKLLNF